jgi:two-component system, LytTR family, response regulator
MSNILSLNSSLGLQIIDVNTIIRIEAMSNYSKLFFTNNKTLVIAKTLQWLQYKLAAAQFSRVHKTHLVNMHFIVSYSNANNAYLFLENGERVHISRRRKKSFLQQYCDTIPFINQFSPMHMS